MVEAQYAGNANYNPSSWVHIPGNNSQEGNTNLVLAKQSLWKHSPRMVFGGVDLSLSTAPDAGQGDTEYRSQLEVICTVVASTGVITPKGAGTCGIEARYKGNDNYKASAWVALAGITVDRANQNFSWPNNPYGASPALTVGGSTLSLDTTPTAGFGATQYQVGASSSPSNACSVANDGVITAENAGTCVIEARYAGNVNYNPSGWVALAGITVAKGTQTFSWPNNPYGASPALNGWRGYLGIGQYTGRRKRGHLVSGDCLDTVQCLYCWHEWNDYSSKCRNLCD